MNKRLKISVALGGALLLGALPMQSQITIGGRNDDAVRNWPSLNTFFDSILEYYPEDVKLFEDTRFVPRLKALVGEARVDYMKKHFDFEYPIEMVDNSYSIMACRTGECGYTDFEIRYMPATNNLCVKYLLDGVEEVYMEKQVRVAWTTYTDEEDFGEGEILHPQQNR